MTELAELLLKILKELKKNYLQNLFNYSDNQLDSAKNRSHYLKCKFKGDLINWHWKISTVKVSLFKNSIYTVPFIVRERLTETNIGERLTSTLQSQSWFNPTYILQDLS